jgi:hypothetical protein
MKKYKVRVLKQVERIVDVSTENEERAKQIVLGMDDVIGVIQVLDRDFYPELEEK